MSSTLLFNEEEEQKKGRNLAEGEVKNGKQTEPQHHVRRYIMWPILLTGAVVPMLLDPVPPVPYVRETAPVPGDRIEGWRRVTAGGLGVQSYPLPPRRRGGLEKWGECEGGYKPPRFIGEIHGPPSHPSMT